MLDQEVLIKLNKNQLTYTSLTIT